MASREAEVIGYLAAGYTPAAAADCLGITANRVRAIARSCGMDWRKPESIAERLVRASVKKTAEKQVESTTELSDLDCNTALEYLRDGQMPPGCSVSDAERLAALAARISAMRNNESLIAHRDRAAGLTTEQVKDLIDRILKQIQIRWGDDEPGFRGFAEWLSATVIAEFPQVAT